MVSLVSLWLPILLSAVFVFIVSWLIHMFLGYHRNDFQRVPDEGGMMDALRPFNLPPGDYFFPRATTSAEMKSEEYLDRCKKGPVAILSVVKNGVPQMGKSLVLWFIYCLIVNFFGAYVTSHALGPGAYYLAVFRFIGATTFIGYSLALLQSSIWYNRKWSTTFKSMFDGLIYSLVTAGVFGWLWPKM